MGLSKGLFVPIGVALTIIRVGLLLGLIFLRLVLTFLQGNQSQLTCQITRFYLICCGLFVIQTGDKSKEETICPINRQSGIDELLLSLSTPIKSIINRDQWKMSSILLRICNMSFGGLNATTPRFVIEGSNDFKNLPQRQKPVSIETNCFSPFQLQNTDSALISTLKIISAPLTVYQIRFLNPKNLAEEENPAEAVLETIKKSISNPNPSHLYRLPTPQAPVRPAPVPNTARLSAALLQQVDTVLEVFPQLSRDHVISDLVRSGDLNETIQNAMSGKIPMAEIKNKAGSKQKSNPVDPKIQDEVDKSIEDGSNPIKAWMNLDERRTALLHFARNMLNGAPVTRNLLIGLGVSTLVAIQFKNGTFLRKILGNFTFSSGNHLSILVEGAIGLYQMSQVERIIGSSILFTRLFSTTFLLLMSNMIFSSFNVPQVLVFSLFPAFLQLVVPTRKLKLGWKFSVSEKMITYAVMGITFNFNQDSAVAGIIIGVLMMQWNEEIIPIAIEETEVKDPIGATIEIQRKMRMDEAEERFTRQQMEQIRIREQHIQRQIRRQQPARQATPTPPYVPSESEIQALVSMGFDAERVRRALIHHRGNVTAACEQLISGN